MALFTVRPTRLDRQTAAFVADHTNRAIQQTASTLTWGRRTRHVGNGAGLVALLPQ